MLHLTSDQKLYLAILALYIFVYCAVMVDTQRRHAELEDKTRDQRIGWTWVNLWAALLLAAYCLWHYFMGSKGSAFSHSLYL
jgi:small-conductance mechanosensitive channel